MNKHLEERMRYSLMNEDLEKWMRDISMNVNEIYINEWVSRRIN